jgi:hypothetical protein
MEEPSFRAGWHLFRCWRGPAWINTVWFLVPALRRFGYGEEADRILCACVELIDRHGFREYYNPLNGEGLAARRFGWSTLLVDLIPSAQGGQRSLGVTPYVGSVPDELLSMGAEAATGARQKLNETAAAARDRFRPR